MAFDRSDISTRRPDDTRPGYADGDDEFRQVLARATLEPQAYLRRRKVCRDVRRHLQHDVPLYPAAELNTDRAAPAGVFLKQGW